MSWWAILKIELPIGFTDPRTEIFGTEKDLPISEDSKRSIDKNPLNLLALGIATGKTWAKDEAGFSKYREILETCSKINAEPAWIKENFISEEELGYFEGIEGLPRGTYYTIEPHSTYWDKSTGWNINELDNMIMIMHSIPGVGI